MLKQPLENAGWTVRPVGDLSDVPADMRQVEVPARVPGCVHTDLLRARKIPDPYLGLNSETMHWIGLSDWRYRCVFEADEKLFDHERIDLACDGLDTVATVELNGQVLECNGETPMLRKTGLENMHRSYRFDVRKQLKRGRNELVITFASPVKYALALREKLGRRPYVNGPAGPFNFIRKMACNFGWDWGPALTTSGIWRGVRLEGWSVARISSIEPLDLLIDRAESEYAFHLHCETTDGAAIAQARVVTPHGETFQTESSIERGTGLLTIRLPLPELWSPRGHGEQNLYELEFTVIGLDDRRLDLQGRRIGLRTVDLDTAPDDIGRKFVVKVNGKPIFCKGFNWIPDDCFLDRANDPARVRRRLQQAADAGANMIRVWGGGIYETDDFYNICDELGLMVWQDFPFACAMYPEEEPLWSEVEAEARENVMRIASHPSLTVLNGCNENIWAYRDWGWKDHKDVVGRTWGKGYYFDLLPRICREVAPHVPYWAGSPWSGDYDVDNGIPPNAATHGNKHVWEAWFKEDYSVYRNFAPRFCSEFGFQAPATHSSIVGALRGTGSQPVHRTRGHGPAARATELDFGSIEMRHRQRSGDRVRDDGDRRNLRHLIRHFNLPGAQQLLDALGPPDPNARVPECGAELLHPASYVTTPPGSCFEDEARARHPSQVYPDFDDLHYLLQLNQCRALTLGVEWFRSRQPVCMGTLYWQLNDCWPGATSWSCVDGDGHLKPLWYATRRFYAPLLLTIQPEPDGSLALYACNDSDEPLAWTALIARRAFDGTTLAEEELGIELPPRQVRRFRLSPRIYRPARPELELLTVGEPARAAWFFGRDRDLQYPEPRYRGHLERAGDKHRLTIIAGSLLRDVCLFADRIDPEACISEQLVTLLPGQGFTFVIESKKDLDAEQLLSPPVFQCANRFGASRDRNHR